jgi:hypothetical protein
MLYGNDRRELREVFFRAWHKHRQGQPLEGAENVIVAVALRHPEYHALLDRPEHHTERDYFPELGETNPFLHMALHVTIEEQLAINQPPGIRARYHALVQLAADEHAAQHRVMDCLGESLWQAGRSGTPPDAGAYLACLARLSGVEP